MRNYNLIVNLSKIYIILLLFYFFDHGGIDILGADDLNSVSQNGHDRNHAENQWLQEGQPFYFYSISKF